MSDAAIKLFFAGDFCCRPSTSVISVDDDLKRLIQSADAAICNFEIPLKTNRLSGLAEGMTPEQAGYFYQNDDAPRFLETLGFSYFSFSNNHAFDCGEDGWEKTRNAFSDPENLFGSGTYEEACKVKTIEIDGVRIGFMALSYASKFGRFHDLTQRKEGKGCAYVNDLCVNHIIAEAKHELDYVFILPHDGIEYIDVPIPETIARYRDFIDWGADAVIGSHPHCPQGWETYKGKPIFYSLGNFFFNSRTVDYRASNRPHWYEGLAVMLSLKDGGVSFDIFNTKNTDNVRLGLDTSVNRDKHNSLICQYLIDEKMYWVYYTNVVSKQICRQEGMLLRMIDNGQKKAQVRYHLSRAIRLLLGKTSPESEREIIINLLQNPTRTTALLHWLRRQ